MFKENFSEAELEEAKKNGFILTGKTEKKQLKLKDL